MSDLGVSPKTIALLVGVYVVAPVTVGAGVGAGVGMLMKRQRPVRGALIGAGVGVVGGGATAAILRARSNAKEAKRLAVLRAQNAAGALSSAETARRQRWIRRADFLACVMQNDADRGVPGAQAKADEMKLRAQTLRGSQGVFPAGEPQKWTGAQPPWCGAPQ